MKNVFSSMQWMFFILANIVVIPVSVGAAYGLPVADIATLLQRTFFVIGITSLLQGLFGHKLPLNEGPAGLWWSLFLIFAGMVASGKQEASIVLRSLELGIFIAGGIFLLLSVFRLINPIKKLFTPLVTGTYLVLLVSQLSGPFVKGILGVDYLSDRLDPKVAITAVIILILTVILAKSRFKFLSSYSILISLATGWILFALLKITKPMNLEVHSFISVPKVFTWGTPTFDAGIVLTSIFTAFLLLTNLVASAEVVSKVSESKEPVNYPRSTFIMGINHLISGAFSVIGAVPLGGAAGFIATTRIKERLPFLIGSTAIMLMSFFPVLMAFLASLPVPLGYATIFLAISSLIGLGLNELRTALQNPDAPAIISLSLMGGFGLMAVPEDALSTLPELLVSLVNNGLIIGVIIAIVLEQIFRKRQAIQERRQTAP
ncbi:purine/pyrimidine permease [Aciduricibacillus chroicocephali]|uniref:Purine/pyrimidine permease n=1 Tax=Aciduricibacillus chroicocephali TaxID=3054939 RepID=A0ABY9KV26_9BACI|nr:purine/pyrimidine permease [Bacillaceae bacterium 44XB]